MSIASEIRRIREQRNKIRTKMVELQLAESTDNLSTLATKFDVINAYDDSTCPWYAIAPTLSNVTAAATNVSAIGEDETVELSYTVAEKHKFPDTVAVTGATSTWDSTSGTLSLSNPTANVVFTLEGIPLKSYTLTLSGISSYNWTTSSVTNPDPTLYDGVYQSNSYNVHSSYAVMKITFSGYSTFNVYIRSYAESYYDYTIASTLDAASYPTANGGSYAKTSTYGNQQSGTSLSSYTKVSYPNDGNEHWIYITYRKDGSATSGTDRGYVLIEK